MSLYLKNNLYTVICSTFCPLCWTSQLLKDSSSSSSLENCVRELKKNNNLVCCWNLGVYTALCLDSWFFFVPCASEISDWKTLWEMPVHSTTSVVFVLRLWGSNSMLWFSLSEVHPPAALLLTVCARRLEIGDKQSVTTALLPGWQ